MPKNKAKGSKIERELVKLLTEQGWRAVRVAGSGVADESPCDLLAAKLGKKGHAIEVKSSKKPSIYIKKSQISDFMMFAEMTGLKPAIALRFNHEGWLFISPNQLRDTGKYWVASLESAKQEGKKVSQFFEDF